MRFDTALRAWVGILERRLAWVLALTLVLTTVAGLYAVGNLSAQTDIAELFSPDLPFRKTNTAYRQRFLHEIDTLAVVIDGPTPELVAQSARQLQERLSAQNDLIEQVHAPRSSPFLETHALLYLDVADLERLTDRLAQTQPLLVRLSGDPTAAGLAELLAQATTLTDAGWINANLGPIFDRTADAAQAARLGQVDYLSWQELITGEDATIEECRAVLLVRPRLDAGGPLAAAPVIEHIRATAAELRIDAAHDLRLRITGSVALRHDELKMMLQGAVFSTVLAFALVTIVLYVGLRSVRLLIASLIALVIGLVWTAAFAALAIGHLNLISIAFGVLYVGLGIDYAIHLCLRYQELLAEGHPRDQAVRGAMGDVGVSLLLCAVTTSLAFFAFIPTDFLGVSELGLIAGAGIFISLAVNLTVLPSLLLLLGPPARKVPRLATLRLLEFPRRHARLVRIVTLALVIVTVPSLWWVRFDLDPLNLRNESSESVSTLRELLAHNATSPWHIVVLEDDETQLKLIKEQLTSLQVVDRVVALPDFIPTEQAAKLDLIDDVSLAVTTETWANTPEPTTIEEQLSALGSLATALGHADFSDPDTARSAARLRSELQGFLQEARQAEPEERRALLSRLDEGLLGALPATLRQLQMGLKTTGVDPDTLPESLVDQWRSDDGVYRLAVFPSASMSDPNAVRQFVTAVRQVVPDAVGAPVFHAAAADAVVGSFRGALTLSALVIGLLLMAVLRSVSDALIVLTPVVLSGLLLSTTAVLIDLPFNFANVIAIPLLIGLGVDSGIHMVMRSRAISRSNVLATSTSRGVLYSALTTIAGFGALSLSPHPGLASLGRMLMLGILFVLIGTLIILPALLKGASDLQRRS
jgi:hypothetical protein